MVSTDYIIAMTSICDTAVGFNRLLEALLDIDRQVKKKQSIYKTNMDILNQEVEIVKSYMRLRPLLQRQSLYR